MCRPDFSSLPIRGAFQQLTVWLETHMPVKLLHDHEKISDAQLIAVALLQRIHKIVYFRCWWRFLKLNHFAWFPSEAQARIRLARLTPVVERLSVEVQKLDFVVIDSEPLPRSTFKRASRCKFPGAGHGFGTSGLVYGFKLHAWTTFNGKIAEYDIHPAISARFHRWLRHEQRLARVWRAKTDRGQGRPIWDVPHAAEE